VKITEEPGLFYVPAPVGLRTGPAPVHPSGGMPAQG